MDATPPPSAEQPTYPPAPEVPPGQAQYGQPQYGQPPYGQPPHSRSDALFDAVRRVGIVRTQERWIGGVAGGIARRLGVDPLLVRGLLGITFLFGGAGLILYGVGWALLPEQVDGRIHLQETIQGRFDKAVLGAIGMFLIGVNTGGGRFGFWSNDTFGWFGGLLWLSAIVTIVWLVTSGNGRQARAGQTGPPPTYSAGPQGYPGQGYPGQSHSGQGYPAQQGQPAPSQGYATAQRGYPAGQQSYPPAPVPPAPAGAYSAGPAYAAGPPAFAQGAPYAYGPAPVPPVPPRPRKPYVRGPGAGAVGIVIGLTLLALAALLTLQRHGGPDWPVGLTAGGIGIVLAGLGIIIAGLRGRSSGTLGFLAIMGILVAVPASAVVSSTWTSSASNVRIVATDGAWAPTTAAQAGEGVAVGVGDVKVDLTQVPFGDGPVRVPINLGAGDLTVTVPPGVAVSADVRLSAGDISWEVDHTQRISGVSGSHRFAFASDEIAAGASPELVLQIETGAGQVRVVEGN